MQLQGIYNQGVGLIGPTQIFEGYAMVRELSPSTKAVGFWSAVFATAFSITYIIGQLVE